MDNLTHSLVGAALSRAGLDRRTPLATATLVVAANAPDIDVLSFVRGPYFALSFRRGITPSSDPAVPREHRGRDEERQHEERRHAVRDSAPEREREVRAADVGEDVDVGGVGRDDEGRGGERGAPVQPRARERGADERVGEVVHPLAPAPRLRVRDGLAQSREEVVVRGTFSP